LYTELGELSNEIGFFKYWKKNKKDDKERQYDEWADCMHFMASLGNKYGHSEDFYDIDELSGVSSAYTTLSYHYIFEKLYHTDF
ncbi:dUTPase, partial [Bacillus cereus]